MERKRSTSSEEDSSELKRCRKKFTEIESTLNGAAKYLDEPLGDDYQPQFSNYQLIGDLVAIGILNSKSLIVQPEFYAPVELIQRQQFCNVAWSVQDLLIEMKSKKLCYPIAKKVILSVGYNDYRLNSMSADMFVECLEKVIEKLRRRGCAELMVTNVPPCGMECDSINHWKYLQIINEEIFRICRKHDFIEHCDIFKLFCRPKNLFSPNNKEYVSYSEINYKIDFTMYNEVGPNDEIDLISFSSIAKIVLGKHVAKSVEKRVEFLHRGQVDKVICVLKEASDDSDSEDELVIVKVSANRYGSIIDLDAYDEDSGGNCQDGDSRNEMVVDGQTAQEISTTIEKPNDMKEKASCEMPLEVQPSVDGGIRKEKSSGEVSTEGEPTRQVTPCRVESVDDIKNEKPSDEVSPEGEPTGQVTPRSVGNIKKEKTSGEVSLEGERTEQVTPRSVEGVGDIKKEKTSGEVSPEGEPTKQVIPYSIEGDIKKEKTSGEVSSEGEPTRQVVCSVEGVGDIKNEKPSGEVSPEGEPTRQVTPCSVEGVGDIKKEKPSSESSPVGEPTRQVMPFSILGVGDIKKKKISGEVSSEVNQMKQVIPCSIESVGDINKETTCKVVAEGKQISQLQVIPCSSEGVGDTKKEKTSSKVPAVVEPSQQVIQCSIAGVGVIRKGNPCGKVRPEKEEMKPVSSSSVKSVAVVEDGNMSCDMPQNTEIKQELISDIDEMVRKKREVVQNIEILERVNSNAVSNAERSEPKEPKIVSNIQKSESVRQDTVSNPRRPEGTGDQKHSIPKDDGRLGQVLFCNFKDLAPDKRASDEIPPEDGQLKDNSSKKSDNVDDKKPSSKMPKDLPVGKVILCSIRRFAVEEEKPSVKREK